MKKSFTHRLPLLASLLLLYRINTLGSPVRPSEPIAARPRRLMCAAERYDCHAEPNSKLATRLDLVVFVRMDTTRLSSLLAEIASLEQWWSGCGGAAQRGLQAALCLRLNCSITKCPLSSPPRTVNQPGCHEIHTFTRNVRLHSVIS